MAARPDALPQTDTEDLTAALGTAEAKMTRVTKDNNDLQEAIAQWNALGIEPNAIRRLVLEAQSVRAANVELEQKIHALNQAIQLNTKTDLSPYFAVDKVIASLATGSMGLRTPQKLELGDSEIATLRIALSQTPQEIGTALAKSGFNVLTNIVVIAPEVEAKLYSVDPGIVVTDIGITRMPMGTAPQDWQWRLEAKSVGRQRLKLAVNVILHLTEGEKEYVKSLTTLEREVEVFISDKRLVTNFIQDYWQWLWTTLLVPAFGIYWKLRQSKREKNSIKEPTPTGDDGAFRVRGCLGVNQ